MAAARMHPHMMSRWANPRGRLRRRMNSFSRNRRTNRAAKCLTLAHRWPGFRNACHPRRQYMRVGGRCSQTEYR